jgi:uncharacterized protein YjbI with pentapeptide repeats/glucose/arabinose dehydrogenase
MNILHVTIFAFITLFSFYSLSEVYAEPIIYDNDYKIEKFVTGLKWPTTMTFVGDDILVLEKDTGKVIRIKDNGVVYNEPVLDVPVNITFESGLLGIASVSNHVFLYFTESESGFDKEGFETSKHIVYQYDWNGKKLTNPTLIKELPAVGYLGLHGGVMTTGLNNEVYFAIGDQFLETIFQNIPTGETYETGSIFKIDTKNNNDVELFAMGVRNSFGLAVDPVTGYLWDTENGAHYFDEINLVTQGFNSGWNSVMGPIDRDNGCTPSPDTCTDTPQIMPPPFENFVYSDPEFSWYNTVAPTAIAFPDKNSSRKYLDSMFVGDFNNGIIYKFQLNTDRTGLVFSNPRLSDLVLDDNDEIDEILFARDFYGISDIKFRGDVMYVTVLGDGVIYKIYPKEPLSPLKQYQNGVSYKKIVCKSELMPIMRHSGGINCVYPKTALILIDEVGWSVNQDKIPMIELKNQDLQGLNFEYMNLANSDFRRANFDTANISNVNFTQANLSYTDLSGKDLTGTILTGAYLNNSNLRDVDLSGKDLTGTVLTGADLTNSNLTGTDLSGKNLTGTILTGVDLSGKNLTGTKLRDVDLSGKDLTGTVLTGADLTNSNLTGTDLSGKDLTGTILTGAYLNNSILRDVDLSGKNLTGTKLRDVDLSGKDLTGTLLTDANLVNANLTNANLTNANLTNANLTNTNLENAVLTGTILNCLAHPICD